MLGLIVFGFIIGLAFSAYYRADTVREIVWNIILAVVTSIQGMLLVPLISGNDSGILSLVILLVWVLGFLYLKRTLLSPKNIKYLGV